MCKSERNNRKHVEIVVKLAVKLVLTPWFNKNQLKGL